MKTLFVLLILALALAGGFWKTQHPDATLDDLRNQGMSIVDRLKGGLVAVKEGSAAKVKRQKLIDEERAALTTRLTSIDDGQQTLKNSISSITNGQQALLSQFSTVDQAEQRLVDLQQAAEKLGESSSSVLTRLEAIDGRLELLTRRLDEDTATADIAALDQQVNVLNTGIENLGSSASEQQTELLSSLATIDEKTDSLEARFNTLSSDTSNGEQSAASINASIDQRLAQIEKKLATTNTDSRRLQSVAERLTASSEKIASVEERFDTIDTKIGQLDENMQTLQTKNESVSIDSLQAEISAQLKALQTQVDNSGKSTDVDSLTSSLETTRSRIQTLEQRVQDLPASSSAADDAQQMQSALQSQIAALEERLSTTLNAPDPALVSTLSEVKEQVAELTSQAFVTRDELLAKQKGKNIEYKIYFDRNSTLVTEDAAKVLNSFIAQEQNRTTGVSIYGFTDRIGPAIYNQHLAQERATNVRSYLIQNGFDYTKIRAVSGLGEDAAAAIQEDDLEDAQQRSVVLFAAQP